MLKIAICDDDVQELSRISGLLNQYKSEKNAVLKYDAFGAAIELLESMRRQTYDVLLLDVLMPGMSGLAAAHEIRGFDPAIKIIFLTLSPEFAVESYAVNAHYYLLKPATTDKLFPVLDRIFLEKDRKSEYLNILQSSGLLRLHLGRVEFVEVCAKRLMFYFDDGSVKEIRGSFSAFEDKLLCKDNFIKVHRSFIVNMEYIQSINARDITTYTGKSIPISRLMYNHVKESYMQFLFLEKGVE
ncbi:MAG: LytTR family DNA-binding domain-containing protein [Eubacteriales bacterium]|jgi:DNA-binding LytR/AlgR family response regulator|nr:LytTR family DNA-binding domain-containing protein [Eubacteriales bacterium]